MLEEVPADVKPVGKDVGETRIHLRKVPFRQLISAEENMKAYQDGHDDTLPSPGSTSFIIRHQCRFLQDRRECSLESGFLFGRLEEVGDSR